MSSKPTKSSESHSIEQSIPQAGRARGVDSVPLDTTSTSSYSATNADKKEEDKKSSSLIRIKVSVNLERNFSIG